MSLPVTIGPFVDAKVKTGAVFPVTTAEFKRFHEIDFNDHDGFIASIVEAATFRVESYTGCSLVPKVITVNYESLSGDSIELPRGPVTSAIDVKVGGQEIAADFCKISAGDFPVMDMKSDTTVTITYEAGYTHLTIPGQLKTAILWQAWEQFMKKNGVIKTGWKSYAAEYRRPNRCL